MKINLPTTFKRKKEKEVSIWHLIFFMPFLVAMFFVGLWMINQNLALQLDGTKTQGEITHVAITDGDDSPQYKPSFVFQDEAGGSYEKAEPFSSNIRYEEGQTVEIIYLQNHPKKTARINNWTNLWLLPLILFGVGGGVSTTLLLGYRNREKSPANKPQTSKDAGLLLTGTKITSRYWQTVREGGIRKLEVQYIYENHSYKTRSQALTDKQLKKLIPGEEVTLRVDPRNPQQAIIVI